MSDESAAAEAERRLLDIAAQDGAAEGIRQGLADVKEGRVRPAREFFDEFEERYGIDRECRRVQGGHSFARSAFRKR